MCIRDRPYTVLPEFPAQAPRRRAQKKGTEVPRVYVPNDVLYRDLTATDSGDTGDKLIATELGAVIEPLRNVPVLQQLGARVQHGLRPVIHAISEGMKLNRLHMHIMLDKERAFS